MINSGLKQIGGTAILGYGSSITVEAAWRLSPSLMNCMAEVQLSKLIDYPRYGRYVNPL